MSMPDHSHRDATTCELKKKRIDGHERMMLTGADRDAFLEVALEPPAPTDKLIAALRRHRSLMG